MKKFEATINLIFNITAARTNFNNQVWYKITKNKIFLHKFAAIGFILQSQNVGAKIEF